MRSPLILHLVCFDLPLPPWYGGTEEIDVKIRCLLDLGVTLHVHALVWPSVIRSGNLPDWHQRVASLRCYPRRWLVGPHDTRPWSLISRSSSDLIRNLQNEPGSILLEGWQCADVLRSPSLQKRNIWVRSHNIESNYYRMQADSTSGWMKKIHFTLEAWRWRCFERSLPQWMAEEKRRGILSICPSETFYWNSHHLPAYYVPAFADLTDRLELPEQVPVTRPKEGPYALYHGRLDIAENIRAIHFLLDRVDFPRNLPLMIAGSRIPDAVRAKVYSQKEISLVDTPSSSQMQDLLRHATVHCIPCYGMAGLRFKIIHAMLGFGHVLVSREGVDGMPWAEWLTVVESEADWEHKLLEAMQSPPDPERVAARQAWVRQHFDGLSNASKILEWIGAAC